jgi:hypothetical protein
MLMIVGLEIMKEVLSRRREMVERMEGGAVLTSKMLEQHREGTEVRI